MTSFPSPWRAVIFTSLAWLTLFSSCASQQITTWYLDAKDKQELIRKDDSGNVIGQMAYVDANGYLCYSPGDDTAWRNRMGILEQCCQGQ